MAVQPRRDTDVGAPVPKPALKPESRREQKKAATRAALIDVSHRLFSEHGYANTTLEAICAEVQIRPQTLLRYFESKAHLALAPLSLVVADLRWKMEGAGRSTDAVALWREHVAARALYHQVTSAHAVRQYYTWLGQDPVLTAMTAELNYETQLVLSVGIAADNEAAPDDLHSTMLAALLVSGWNAVFVQWLGSDTDAAELDSRQNAVIDYAVANLRRTDQAELGSSPD